MRTDFEIKSHGEVINPLIKAAAQNGISVEVV